MTTAISPRINIVPDQHISPVESINQVIELVDEYIEITRAKHGRNADNLPFYRNLLRQRNLLNSAINNINYMANHELMRTIGADMERITKIDPETKGFIITIDLTPNAPHHALLNYSL